MTKLIYSLIVLALVLTLTGIFLSEPAGLCLTVAGLVSVCVAGIIAQLYVNKHGNTIL